MTDEIIRASNRVPTVEQQERIAAAERAVRAVCFDKTTIDEDTARLIGLPLEQRLDPEAVMRAAFATKLRVSHIWFARASGVALDADGNEVANERTHKD